MRRCFRLTKKNHERHETRQNRAQDADHRSLYGVAVIPRPLKMVWLLMNISFRDENTAPFVTMRSLMILGSDTTTKSWLPSQMEYISPNFFAQ